MDSIAEALTPARPQVPTGRRSAKEVRTEPTPRINERLRGWHPTQGI
jgi:hypothetical protein